MSDKNDYAKGLLHGVLIVLGILLALALIWGLAMGGMMSRMMG